MIRRLFEFLTADPLYGELMTALATAIVAGVTFILAIFVFRLLGF